MHFYRLSGEEQAWLDQEFDSEMGIDISPGGLDEASRTGSVDDRADDMDDETEEEFGCVVGPLLLSLLIVVCGTASTITMKLMYNIRAEGVDTCALLIRCLCAAAARAPSLCGSSERSPFSAAPTSQKFVQATSTPTTTTSRTRIASSRSRGTRRC